METVISHMIASWLDKRHIPIQTIFWSPIILRRAPFQCSPIPSLNGLKSSFNSSLKCSIIFIQHLNTHSNRPAPSITLWQDESFYFTKPSSKQSWTFFLLSNTALLVLSSNNPPKIPQNITDDVTEPSMVVGVWGGVWGWGVGVGGGGVSWGGGVRCYSLSETCGYRIIYFTI